MAEAAEETGLPTSTENFADLLEESFAGDARLFGKVVTGSVVSVENDFAIVDVGLKSEGTVPIREFRGADGDINVNIGDDVDVFVERFEDRSRTATALLSSPATKPGAKKPGPSWKKPSKTRNGSTVLSSDASRAALRSIWPALSRSCRAARSISARCAMRPH